VVVVIFVHEAGHYAGMKGFGYRDVKMFFIPLFGGGVSGEGFRAPEYQRAIVSLLGPVPGVLLGSALLLTWAFAPVPWLARFGLFFLALNLLNLLPVFPLDGGHFFEHILFRRSRYAEAGFRVLAGAVLLGAGALLDAWWLAVLGVLTFTSISYNFRLRTIAEEIRRGLEPLPESLGETPPPAVALAILARVRPAFSYFTKPRPLAEQVKRVWEQVNIRPAGALATVLLLAVYTGTFFLALLVAVVVAISPSGRQWLQSHQQAAAEREIFKSSWEECVQEGRQALMAEHYADSEAAYREALEALNRVRATDFCRGQTLLGLGRALDLQGKAKEAETHLREALALHEKELGRNHPHSVEALEALAANCRKRGHNGEAEALEARARAARLPAAEKAREKARLKD
jgi:Zn-dependent protease